MKFHLGELTVRSPQFEHGARMPDECTCEGADVSPELVWENVPEGTAELVVVCHDPDAPLTDGYTHWVMAGIPPDATGLPKGSGTKHSCGVNDFGNEDYGGPAPPPGHGTHHYFFHLYAVGEPVGDISGLSRTELMDRIDDSIIEQARIVGTYSR